MILKGNQRGGGQQLAAHLMNSFDNERVEIADMRGAIADDLSGAFAEWAAQASATKIKTKYFYSLSANPDQAQGHLTREQYFDLIERTERSLKLVGQPRAVVFHEKRDKDGELREHCHVVWSRVDMRQEKTKAVLIEHDRLKLRTVAREFARDHGLELPDGMKKDGRRDRFNDRARQENLAERQQKERTGISKAERMADITRCWKETGNGAAFVNALEAKGYYLARGNQRAYVVVDLNGEVHSLARQIEGVKTRQLKERLSGYPPDKLPDVEAARAWAKKEREQRQKQQERAPSEVEKRRDALKAHQQQRRDDLDKMRINLIGRHMTERDLLKAAQQAQNTGVVSARLQKQPKGFMAFLTRITGIKLIVEARQKQQDKARVAEHKQQTQALHRTHDRELQEMDRLYRVLAGLDVRENRSAETALKREQFLQLVRKKQPQRDLKPEFDRAAQGHQRTGTGDGKPLKDTFDKAVNNKAAKPSIDLTAAFNREVENRISREDRDRDPDGPDRGFDPKNRNR